ncbi:MAG: 1,4-beta-xylanase [Bacteroidales bacterium]|nr:1,4-beta-xylanase [Bacteroidales bacterium]MCB9013932.1 1,4-beta-xylanase [Bacteroidales bacterium]
MAAFSCQVPKENANKVWTPEQANKWYENEAWPVGCNFTPSTAINTIEMWDAGSYDSSTIDRELSWAENIGFNTLRVNFHYLVWVRNPETFKQRLENFLEITSRHGFKVMFVFYDDCWNQNPSLGKQPDPVPGVHNSGWVQCPGGPGLNADTALWKVLKAYQQDIMITHKDDSRIFCWDLYNEAGNSGYFNISLPLLKKSFEWAREVNPSQPITSGMWNWSEEYKEINDFIEANSDIISFHHYGPADDLENLILRFKKSDRPVICTEYMARQQNSRFQTHLPRFKKYKVGAINWGLVSGKTNTIYPWGSPINAPEPQPWFHDIFHKDGSPYDVEEVDFIKNITSEKD